jgi:hypothetical protein
MRLFTIEHKNKLRLAKLGKPSPRRGAHLTSETRLKLSLQMKGRFSGSANPMFGKSGSLCPSWKGGITPVHELIRRGAPYLKWRQTVLRRDGYRCLDCGVRGGWDKEQKRQVTLNADHIYQFAIYPRLRLDVDNGRTLCEDCHKRTPTYGRPVNSINTLMK